MSEGRSLIEALTAFELLGEVLAAVKGRPLLVTRDDERLEGLGWLAEELLRDREGWRESLVAGRTAVRRRWDGELRRRTEPWFTRGVAALYREWGFGAVAHGELAEARTWLEQSLELMGEVLAAEQPPWPLPACGHGWDRDVQTRLGGALLAEHQAAALAAMESGELDRAVLHWQLLVDFAGLAPELAAVQRATVAARWCALAEGMVATGTSRGVQSGQDAAVEHLSRGLRVEPESATLHRQLVTVGVRVALWKHALGLPEAFRAVALGLAPSVHALERARIDLADAELRDRMAEAWVILATQADHPRDAVSALRRSLDLNPHHPTASKLLGQALAALAARRFGAGDGRGARAALSEALQRLPYRNPQLQRLSDALRADLAAAGRHEAGWFEAPADDAADEEADEP